MTPTQYYEQARELAMNDALIKQSNFAVLGEGLWANRCNHNRSVQLQPGLLLEQ